MPLSGGDIDPRLAVPDKPSLGSLASSARPTHAWRTMKCPCCNGKRFIVGFDGRDECYLCRSLGVVTPEASRQWFYEQDQERIRQLRMQLARDAAESTQWQQLAFDLGDEVKTEKPKKVCCQPPKPLPSTTDRQPSLAFDHEMISHGQQHGAYAVQHAAV
jgi:hypothetical protein